MTGLGAETPITNFVMLNLFQHPSCRTLQRMAQTRAPCVYILASQPRGTLYVGVTSNLEGRLWQHRECVLPGFTDRYRVKLLVWFERHVTMEPAILREKQIKNWRRQWKINLIEERNPHWEDLAIGLGFDRLGPDEPRNGP
jgi:putative endonuclease